MNAFQTIGEVDNAQHDYEAMSARVIRLIHTDEVPADEVPAEGPTT